MACFLSVTREEVLGEFIGVIVRYKYSLGPGLDSISPDIISNISFTKAPYSISV